MCVCVSERKREREREEGKLMRSNQPQSKFHFKSDSNRLLIDFFNPISAAQFTRRDITIQIRTQNLILNYNLIKNLLNLIKNGQIQMNF